MQIALEERYLFGTVRLGEKGQLVIPKDARDQYGLKPGDSIVVLGDRTGIALVKNEVFMSLIGSRLDKTAAGEEKEP